MRSQCYLVCRNWSNICGEWCNMEDNSSRITRNVNRAKHQTIRCQPKIVCNNGNQRHVELLFSLRPNGSPSMPRRFHAHTILGIENWCEVETKNIIAIFGSLCLATHCALLFLSNSHSGTPARQSIQVYCVCVCARAGAREVSNCALFTSRVCVFFFPRCLQIQNEKNGENLHEFPVGKCETCKRIVDDDGVLVARR